MKKKALIILLPVIVLVVFTASYFGLGNKEKEVTLAQMDFPYADVSCRDPIPSGQAMTETLHILNDTFQHYKALQDYLDLLVATGEEMTGLLKRDPVCDFSVCRSQMISMPPGLDVNACVFCPPGGDTEDCKWCTKITGFCSPACKPLPCYGMPCPALQDPLKIFKRQKALIESETELIHNLFTEPQVELNIGMTPLLEGGEKVGDKITRVDFAERVLELSEKWLAPYKGCVMTAAERVRAEAGELAPRFPARCIDALQFDYWPRYGSFYCQQKKKCLYGFDDECLECLKSDESCEEQSWPAKINCRIYRDCEQECEEMWFNEDCVKCICQEIPDDGDFEEKCLDLICADRLNYVCCGAGNIPLTPPPVREFPEEQWVPGKGAPLKGAPPKGDETYTFTFTFYERGTEYTGLKYLNGVKFCLKPYDEYRNPEVPFDCCVTAGKREDGRNRGECSISGITRQQYGWHIQEVPTGYDGMREDKEVYEGSFHGGTVMDTNNGRLSFGLVSTK